MTTKTNRHTKIKKIKTKYKKTRQATKQSEKQQTHKYAKRNKKQHTHTQNQINTTKNKTH